MTALYIALGVYFSLSFIVCLVIEIIVIVFLQSTWRRTQLSLIKLTRTMGIWTAVNALFASLAVFFFVSALGK